MDTRDQILRLAAHLLIERGYNGFSYANISKSLNIRNAAVHYHFPSKADLGLALVKPCAESVAGRLGLNPATKPLKALKTYIGAVSSSSGKVTDLQIINALTTDFAHLDASIQTAIHSATQTHIAWLAKQLKKGRKRGSLAFSAKPPVCAMTLFAQIMGANQVGRLVPGADATELATSALEQITA